MSTAVTGFNLRNKYCSNHAHLFFMSPCCVQGVDSSDVEHFLCVFKQNALPLICKLKNAQGCDKAMQYVFGRTLLCMNMTCALNFADESDFDCITLDGDQVSVLKSIIYTK